MGSCWSIYMHISSLLWGRWNKQILAAGWWWGKMEAEEAVNSQGGKVTQSWADKGWICGSVLPMASLCSLFLPAIVCIWLCDINTPHFCCPKPESLLGVSAASGDSLVWAYSTLTGLLNSFMVSLYQYLSLIQQLTGETWGLRGQLWCSSTTWICFGDWTLANPFWMVESKLWQRHEAGACHKKLQYFTGPGKAPHKNWVWLLPNRESQAGFSSLILQNYCCHREEAVLS